MIYYFSKLLAKFKTTQVIEISKTDIEPVKKETELLAKTIETQPEKEYEWLDARG